MWAEQRSVVVAEDQEVLSDGRGVRSGSVRTQLGGAGSDGVRWDEVAAHPVPGMGAQCVRGLGEIPIRVAHREKWGRRRRAHHLVDLGRQFLTGRLGSRRNRHHDPCRSKRAQRLHRGTHARARRQTIVDKNHRLARQIRHRPTFPIGARRNSSRPSRSVTRWITSGAIPSPRTTSSLSTTTPPLAIAPIASSS